MSSRWTILLLLTGLQAILLVASTALAALGADPWHHVASLVVVLVLAGLLWRPFARSRRFLAFGVMAFTILALVSGFWLLYWKEGIRVAGYQDWGVFWHVAWSWAAAVFFFQHTWINRVTFVHFFRRSLSRSWGATLHLGAYILVVAAFLLTWSSIGKGWFTVENYIPLSLYAWLVMTAPPYAAWMWMQWRTRTLARASIDQARALRSRLRGGVDLGLVPLAALAVVSGVPLTFFDATMDAQGWKYVSKYWHVWPSVAFAVLVFTHTMQTWAGVRSHWRTRRVRVARATPVAPDQAV